MADSVLSPSVSHFFWAHGEVLLPASLEAGTAMWLGWADGTGPETMSITGSHGPPNLSHSLLSLAAGLLDTGGAEAFRVPAYRAWGPGSLCRAEPNPQLAWPGR